MNTTLLVILGAGYLWGVVTVAAVLYAYGEQDRAINPPDYDTTDE